MMFVIKTGHSYKCREDGTKATVVSYDEATNAFYGYVRDIDDTDAPDGELPDVMIWAPSGRQNRGSKEHAWDIVAEWVDEPFEEYMYFFTADYNSSNGKVIESSWQVTDPTADPGKDYTNVRRYRVKAERLK